ncbi:hypothetical protein CIPAW_04G130600 [Carya illinoinensis]|uniref:Reverse transcriptase zinc-binding domain-containing protein n=1 Tax=Carya illinoinensis TaxID=32201 RepID=A0A8T1QVP1_CARIL|nr:hypothetical protein CIPAW_04G130600 [Carya illinoinensis]
MICKPVEEGGLGIHDLVDVQESLFMKFGWKLISGNSMWSEFFQKKYLRREHVYKAMQMKKGSQFWKGIMEIMPKIIQNSKWLIGNGNINFWMNRWIGSEPLQEVCPVIGRNDLLLADVVDERGPNIDVLRNLVLPDILHQICEAGVRTKDRPDVFVWEHSLDGQFTTKSAWKLYKKCGVPCEWKKWLWLDKIPKKMSFLCWRAKRGIVTTDDVIQNLSIPLASKCNCCIAPNIESLQHVLCEGSNAQMVWKYFANISQIRLPHIRNWKRMMSFWWQRANKQSQAGWIRGMLPIVITWCLWKARCSARMEGVPFQVKAIIRLVKIIMKDVSYNLKNFQVVKENERLVMEELNIPVASIKGKKVTYVKWELPTRGMVKLNVDGGARCNPGEAGGGGII